MPNHLNGKRKFSIVAAKIRKLSVLSGLKLRTGRGKSKDTKGGCVWEKRENQRDEKPAKGKRTRNKSAVYLPALAVCCTCHTKKSICGDTFDRQWRSSSIRRTVFSWILPGQTLCCSLSTARHANGKQSQ